MSLLPQRTVYSAVIHIVLFLLSRLLLLFIFSETPGPPPHENTLQADLGVTHQRQSEKKRNVGMWRWEAARRSVKTLGLLGVIRVQREPVLKPGTTRREEIHGDFGRDGNLLKTLCEEVCFGCLRICSTP